jgi:nitrate reductase gamma subunit
MMVYSILFWAALIILGCGVAFRIDRWFVRDVGIGDREIPIAERVAAGVGGSLGTIFSWRIVKLLKVFVVDVLFQVWILRDSRDPLAWLMHVCIFIGFVMLLVFHALGSIFGGAIAPSYFPTLNPFMFMRNVFGLLLTVGLVLAVARRVLRRRELRTGRGDVVALAILGVIALSGFLLEATKITSEGRFAAMVSDYTGGLSPNEATALRAYWSAEYGLVPARPVPSHDPAVMTQGRQLSEAGCQGCHAKPRAAFVSYAVSRAIAPVAVPLDRAGSSTGLWWVHVVTCLFGLAYVAFSKMFHVISTPVSLMAAEAALTRQSPGVMAVRQVVELDGCSHGGACHDECPVRRRRMDRIGQLEAFEPMLAYVAQKSAHDLGSRPVTS